MEFFCSLLTCLSKYYTLQNWEKIIKIMPNAFGIFFTRCYLECQLLHIKGIQDLAFKKPRTSRNVLSRNEAEIILTCSCLAASDLTPPTLSPGSLVQKNWLRMNGKRTACTHSRIESWGVSTVLMKYLLFICFLTSNNLFLKSVQWEAASGGLSLLDGTGSAERWAI